jgi:hypothetical protein
MSAATSEIVQQVLWWAGLFALLASVGYVAVSAFFSWVIDSIWPPTADEISAREAERKAKQATKEFKRRKRVRSFRFF